MCKRFPPHLSNVSTLPYVENTARGVQNMHHWSGWTETATAQMGWLGHVVTVAAFVSGVVDSCRSVMLVLYTSLAIFPNTLLSTGFKSGEFGGHSWGWINSGVSLSNNSIVARARWAFHVSQGSVETLFRWGGKRLHSFAANLFRKLRTKCHCPSFMRDITKKRFGLFFFLDTVYNVYPLLKWTAVNISSNWHDILLACAIAYIKCLWHRK